MNILYYILLLQLKNRSPRTNTRLTSNTTASNSTNRIRTLRQGPPVVINPNRRPGRPFRPRPPSSRTDPLSLEFTATRSPLAFNGALSSANSASLPSEVLFNGFSTVVKSCFADTRFQCHRRQTSLSRAECIRLGCCWNPQNSIQCGKSQYFVVSLKTGPDFAQCGIPDPQPQLVNPPFNDILLGFLFPRIIGGQEATLGEWPWTVLVYFRSLPLSSFRSRVCGGALISNKWIVTAAHCLQTPIASLYNVLLGANNLISFSGNEVIRSVQNLIIHPLYVRAFFDYDVALLELNQTVNFTRFIRPLCLVPSGTPTDSNTNPTFAGTTCVTVGWGNITSPAGPQSNTLMDLSVTIDPAGLCNVQTILNFALYPMGVPAVDGNGLSPKFCASGINATLQDSCSGDSGGPLMCQHSDGRYYLHGITSYGTSPCAAGLPGVYTEVADPLINSFITSNVPL